MKSTPNLITLLIVAYVSVLAAAWMMVFISMKQLLVLTDQIDTYVYSVCQNSRISSTIPEGQCGYAQDYFKREYLCKQNNTNPETQCWVERK